MKLVVTGGGTGGHVYPALVVAANLSAQGAEATYLGSLRGQEAEACRRQGVPFHGFPSRPLYSLKTPRGWRSLVALLRARTMVLANLRANRPDVVFSTGGYSAGPVVSAARRLRIPYVIHEANSVPGRSNLVFAKQAASFTSVFKCTDRFARGIKVTRTGQPIRQELRDAAAAGLASSPQVLVLGGSQGSEFLNEIVPLAAASLNGWRIIHATGHSHIDPVRARVSGIPNYDARPYLDTPELVEAYRSSSLVIARSGGTLAEIAMFGLPSILVPLPTSADGHQLHNAIEFDAMEAATLLHQPMNRAVYADFAAEMANHIEGWMADGPRRDRAKKALLDWDIPDATQRIARLVQEAAAKHAQI